MFRGDGTEKEKLRLAGALRGADDFNRFFNYRSCLRSPEELDDKIFRQQCSNIRHLSSSARSNANDWATGCRDLCIHSLAHRH